MPSSVGRPNTRARRSLGLWQWPVPPGSPDTTQNPNMCTTSGQAKISNPPHRAQSSPRASTPP
eukprot:6265251-Prymnesium_polylepis.1